MPRTLPVSYSTVSLCYVTLSELGSVTTLTSAHVADFIGQAQAFIDAKIVKAYSLPMTQPVDLLQTLCTDMAIYRILTRRLYTAARLEASPWPDRYKEALEVLDDIATGEIPLIDNSGTVLEGRTDMSEVWSTTKGFVPTFSELPTGDDTIDVDKLEDEANRRDLTLRDRLL
jgi:phage gp36-like protein